MGLVLRVGSHRLLEDAGGRGVQLNASRGVDLIMNDNEVDPHAWRVFKISKFTLLI